MTGDTQPRRGRGRTILIVLLIILSSFGILLSTVGIWVRQTALSDDRWAALSARVASDPAVQATVSRRLTEQIVLGLKVEDRIAGALPTQAAFLAGPVTNALERQLEQRIATVLASEQFQTAWVEANRVAHRQLVALLRGDTTVVTLENGQLVLNLLPLVGSALQALQQQGIIPASITLPVLTTEEGSAAAIAKLNSALNVDLPADFGTIPFGDASRLESLQAAFRAFDIILVVTIVLTLVLVVGTVWLSRSRLRGLLAVALGTVVALVLARLAVLGIESAIVDSVASGEGAGAVRGVFEAVAHDLIALLQLLIIGAVVAALVAYLASRPAWLMSIVASTRSAAARPAGAPATAAAATGAESSGSRPAAEAVTQQPSVAVEQPSVAAAAPAGTPAPGPSRRTMLVAWARRNDRALRWGGVGIIAFWLAWAALGWEVAVLAAAFLALWEYGLHALVKTEADESS